MNRAIAAAFVAAFALSLTACDEAGTTGEQTANNTAAPFKLTLSEHISAADANDCKDINSVLVFDVENYPIQDWSGRVKLNEAAMATLREALVTELFYGDPEGELVVKSAYEHAVNALISDFGLTQDEFDDELYLSSCHDMEVVEHFALSLYEGQLEGYTSSAGKSHLTMGIMIGFDASMYDIHVYMDADNNKLAAFLIW